MPVQFDGSPKYLKIEATNGQLEVFVLKDEDAVLSELLSRRRRAAVKSCACRCKPLTGVDLDDTTKDNGVVTPSTADSSVWTKSNASKSLVGLSGSFSSTSSCSASTNESSSSPSSFESLGPGSTKPPSVQTNPLKRQAAALATSPLRAQASTDPETEITECETQPTSTLELLDMALAPTLLIRN
jgi:hypothetical protein